MARPHHFTSTTIDLDLVAMVSDVCTREGSTPDDYVTVYYNTASGFSSYSYSQSQCKPGVKLETEHQHLLEAWARTPPDIDE